MAQVSLPIGFKLYEGDANNTRSVYIPTTDANDMFVGDAVDLTGAWNTAEVSVVDKKYEIGGLNVAALATAGDGNRVYGIIQSFLPVERRHHADVNYRPANSEYVAKVIVVTGALFMVQANGLVDGTFAGKNINLYTGTAGDTTYGRSGHQVDISSVGTGATKQFSILNIYNGMRPGTQADQNVLGSYTYLIVRCNQDRSSDGIAGI